MISFGHAKRQASRSCQERKVGRSAHGVTLKLLSRVLLSLLCMSGFMIRAAHSKSGNIPKTALAHMQNNELVTTVQ